MAARRATRFFQVQPLRLVKGGCHCPARRASLAVCTQLRARASGTGMPRNSRLAGSPWLAVVSGEWSVVRAGIRLAEGGGVHLGISTGQTWKG